MENYTDEELLEIYRGKDMLIDLYMRIWMVQREPDFEELRPAIYDQKKYSELMEQFNNDLTYDEFITMYRDLVGIYV